MARLNLDDINERVAAATGTAAPGAASLMKQGAVFRIDDALIRFPENPRREIKHPERWVVVVQADHLLGVGAPRTVMVVPCSASQAGAGRGDFLMPTGEKSFTKTVVVAYATLVQAVLKSALTLSGHQGDLSDAALGALLGVLARNLNLPR